MSKKKQNQPTENQSSNNEQKALETENTAPVGEQATPETATSTPDSKHTTNTTNTTNNPPPSPPEDTNPAPSPTEMVDVLALVDNNTYGLRCGHVHSLPVDVVDQPIEAGVVDGEQAAIASGQRPKPKQDAD